MEQLSEPFEQELNFLDEVLLKARIEIQQKSAASGGGGGGGGGAGGGAGGAGGGGEASPSAGSVSPDEDLTDGKKHPGSPKDLPPPPNVGSGEDDDIVARQLRELATKETDPEVREKLWDEYRKYKKGK